jgi:hypothetical protein
MTHAARVRDEVSRLATLDQAFRWMFRQEPPWTAVDVVVQDEYTHDVLFGAPDGSFVVFDTT